MPDSDAYGLVLADLRKRRDRLQRLIDLLEADEGERWVSGFAEGCLHQIVMQSEKPETEPADD